MPGATRAGASVFAAARLALPSQPYPTPAARARMMAAAWWAT
jgi:hypothetical protein